MKYVTDSKKLSSIIPVIFSIILITIKTTRNGYFINEFSIQDLQNNFIILRNISIELEEILFKNISCIQPCLLVIGEIHEPKQKMVYFDSIKYKICTIINKLTGLSIIFNSY